MLHEVFGVMGFLLLMVGAGSMDSISMVMPAMFSLAGLSLLCISAFEAGCFNKKNRR